MNTLGKAGLSVLLASLLLVAIPAVYATDLSVTVDGVSNAHIVPGSTVSINNNFNGASGITETLEWIAVVTPNGDTYIFDPSTSIVFTGGASGSIACNVPYGGSGSLSVTGTGAQTVSGCTGTQSLWNETTTSMTFTAVHTACTNGNTPATGATLVDGDTSQSGTYSVLSCYTASDIQGSFVSGDQTFTTPEFGAIGLVLAISLVGILVLRKRASIHLKTPQAASAN